MNNLKRVGLALLALMMIATAHSQNSKGGERSEALLRADGMMIEAKMQQEIGNYERAMQMYEKIVAECPNYGAAYYEMGGILLDDGNLGEALTMTQKALRYEEDNLWYRLQEAAIYEAQKDYDKLVDCWERLVKQYPDKLEYYYQLSDAYLGKGDGEKAVKVLDRVEKRYGVSEQVSLQQKEIWEAMGRSDMALKEIEQLAKAMPNETKYSAMMAEVYMRRKDYKKAKEYYDKILAASPNDPYIHFSLANYYQVTGDDAKGMEEMEKGLRQQEFSCSERMSLLTGYFTGREMVGQTVKDALRLTEVVIADCPDEGMAIGFHGELLMCDNQFDAAAEELKRYIAIDSSRYGTWESLLICLDASENHNHEVVPYAQRAAKLFPLHVLPHYLIGVDAIIRNDYAAARKALQRCEQTGFRHGYLEKQTYAMLGDCCYHQGEYEKAWRYFEKSLRADSNDISTLNNYAYFLAERGEQLEKAERMSHKTIVAEPDNPTYLDTYAWILHKLGRDKEALPFMERALKLSTEDSDTLKKHYNAIIGR